MVTGPEITPATVVAVEELGGVAVVDVLVVELAVVGLVIEELGGVPAVGVVPTVVGAVPTALGAEVLGAEVLREELLATALAALAEGRVTVVIVKVATSVTRVAKRAARNGESKAPCAPLEVRSCTLR